MHHNIHYGANGLYTFILSLFFGSYKPYIFKIFYIPYNLLFNKINFFELFETK